MAFWNKKSKNKFTRKEPVDNHEELRVEKEAEDHLNRQSMFPREDMVKSLVAQKKLLDHFGNSPIPAYKPGDSDLNNKRNMNSVAITSIDDDLNRISEMKEKIKLVGELKKLEDSRKNAKERARYKREKGAASAEFKEKYENGEFSKPLSPSEAHIKNYGLFNNTTAFDSHVSTNGQITDITNSSGSLPYPEMGKGLMEQMETANVHHYVMPGKDPSSIRSNVGVSDQHYWDSTNKQFYVGTPGNGTGVTWNVRHNVGVPTYTDGPTIDISSNGSITYMPRDNYISLKRQVIEDDEQAAKEVRLIIKNMRKSMNILNDVAAKLEGKEKAETKKHNRRKLG
jgi:hypothetical protein